VVIVILIGAAAFVAYRQSDSIRQIVGRWLPARSTSGEPATAATAPQPAQSAAADSQPPGAGTQGVTPETNPAQVAGYPSTSPPPKTAAANAPDRFEIPAEPASRTTRSSTAPPVTPAAPPPAANVTDIPAGARVDAAPPASNPPAQAAVSEPVKQPPAAVATDAGLTPPPKTEPVASPPPPKSTAAAETRTQPPAVPPRGTLVWAGEAAKDQTVTIQGGTASFGSLTGSLPRVPCIVSVQPQDVSVAEAPAPSNGFDKIVLRFRKKGRFTVTISWETLR